jgi:hypothetical protein
MGPPDTIQERPEIRRWASFHTGLLARVNLSLMNASESASNFLGRQQSPNVHFKRVMSTRKNQKLQKSWTLHFAKSAPTPCRRRPIRQKWQKTLEIIKDLAGGPGLR